MPSECEKRWSTKVAWLLDTFDFEKVHTAMVALNWKWSNNRVPTVDRIRSVAVGLIIDCITSDTRECTISTGGFEVYVNHDDRILDLKFMVDCANIYDKEPCFEPLQNDDRIFNV